MALSSWSFSPPLWGRILILLLAEISQSEGRFSPCGKTFPYGKINFPRLFYFHPLLRRGETKLKWGKSAESELYAAKLRSAPVERNSAFQRLNARNILSRIRNYSTEGTILPTFGGGASSPQEKFFGPYFPVGESFPARGKSSRINRGRWLIFSFKKGKLCIHQR